MNRMKRLTCHSQLIRALSTTLCRLLLVAQAVAKTDYAQRIARGGAKSSGLGGFLERSLEEQNAFEHGLQ